MLTDALPLLLNLVWDGEGQTDADANHPGTYQRKHRNRKDVHRFPWPLRWLNWFIPELIGLVQRTRVSYPACFNKIRLTENMVDKRESYTKEDLLASGRGELFGAKARNCRHRTC